MKEPGARLAITGYADKHLEGHPPLADEYNLEPSKIRGQAMLKVLREKLCGCGRNWVPLLPVLMLKEPLLCLVNVDRRAPMYAHDDANWLGLRIILDWA